jgi:hypothetical protein
MEKRKANKIITREKLAKLKNNNQKRSRKLSRKTRNPPNNHAQINSNKKRNNFDYKNPHRKRKSLIGASRRHIKSGYEPDDEGISKGTKRR